MSTSILVAVDLSESSDEALRQAHERAEAAAGTLTVLHVVPNPMHSNPLFPHLEREVESSMKARKRRLRNEVLERVEAVTGRGEDAVEVVVEDGWPHVVIVQQAEQRSADLLVVGSHGSGGGTRFMLGNVAEKVVRHAHGPVLVARPRLGSGVVLVATDFSDASLAAVEVAVDEARRTPARLSIMHSVDLSPGLLAGLELSTGVMAYGAPPAIPAELREAVDDRLSGAMALQGAEGERIVAEGPPATAIVHTAAELHADLVVVGTVGRTGLPRLLLGSVAEAVVRDAPCSVLVARRAAAARPA
jgi:nucleotide-binding universal stress UspA family protein